MKPDFTTRPRIRQSGYALILMVLALMGISGVVLVGFTQGAKLESEQQRYLHNQRVLEEAKRALLQYAYNYPQMGPGQNDGPGRLPCPDTDNDGDENYVPSCNGDMLGRFPWKVAGLDFYAARDASGESLWYAVSNNFGRGGSSAINSDTPGGITVEDRSGAVIHDATAGSGVAAVIIAPGAPIARAGAMQVRGTDDEKKVVANYLDLYGTVDNADFADDDLNGFVTGPIKDVVTGDLLVNDQMIVVTADEVAALAEMATLQAYRSAILDYLDDTGRVYPWLYNYDGIEYDKDLPEPVQVAIDKLSSYFPVGGCNDSLPYPPSWHTRADCVANGGTWDDGFASELEDYLGRDTAGNDDGVFGRIPSTFAEYFTEAESQPIDSTFEMEVTVDGGDFSGFIPYTRTFPDAVSGEFEFVDSLWNGSPTALYDAYNGFTAASINGVVSALRFEDLDPDVGSLDTKITGTFETDASVPWAGLPAPPSYVFFWDGIAIGPTGKWRKCETNGGHIDDCHVDASGLPDVHGTGQLAIRLLRITAIELVFKAGESFEFEIDSSAASPVVNAADGGSHATITGTFAASEINLDATTIRVSYEIDNNYIDGPRSPPNFDVDESGTMDIRGFADPAVTLTLRYFPVLPKWALDNGWHNSIRMAYASEYEPPDTGPCIVDDTCLHLEDSAGVPQNVISLLVIAGQHDWDDDDIPPNGRLKNDLLTVFDNGNENTNPTFYRHRGNDKILVIEEQ